MNFAVQLTRDGAGETAQVVRTITFEERDLRSVVARMRIILATRGYEPHVDAFRVLAKEKLLFDERRDQADAPVS
jgi:hypothetical protein